MKKPKIYTAGEIGKVLNNATLKQLDSLVDTKFVELEDYEKLKYLINKIRRKKWK